MENISKWNKGCFVVKLAIMLLLLGFFMLLKILLLIFMIKEPIISIFATIVVSGILATEIVLHVIFIIGAQTKNITLLKVYYYCALTMWINTIIMFLVCTVNLARPTRFSSDTLSTIIMFIMDILGFIFYIVVHAILLLTLRSEIIKLKDSSCPHLLVNNDNPENIIVNTVHNKGDIYKENNCTPCMV